METENKYKEEFETMVEEILEKEGVSELPDTMSHLPEIDE